MMAELPQDQDEPIKPFVTDQCTLFPDGEWGGCCVEHDRAYWRGGTRQQRREADIELMRCVAARGHPWIAMVMYAGVRMGGTPWLPTAWRWGFGYKFPRGYR
jgi:hypothetical protein